jgi:hypothetical protein
MQLTASVGAAGLSASARAHSDGFPSALPVVVDTSANCTSAIDRFKNLGVKVVVRYYA